MALLSQLIDSHIHLWPHTAANNAGHSWMQSGAPLTRQFSISDYVTATNNDAGLRGFVYIETDRSLGKYDPADLDFKWADQTFEELRWIRRIVEGTPGDGEGFGEEHGSLLLGAVIWAPVDHGVDVFRRYVRRAWDAAGGETWARVRGFRFLFQGIHDEKHLRELVLSDEMADIWRSLPDLDGGMAFDIGVDTRSGGVWQLEVVTEAIQRLRAAGGRGRDTVFILNHMCKPDYMAPTDTHRDKESDFQRWKACITELSRDGHVYMKLSGGFSEMQRQDPAMPRRPSEILQTMKPWTDVLFDNFQPDRVMFGSDWPVCNVNGPGNAQSWLNWKAVVEGISNSYELNEKQKDWLWRRSAAQAYNLR